MARHGIDNGSNFDYYFSRFDNKKLEQLKIKIEDLVANQPDNVVKKKNKWKNKQVTPIQNQLVYFNGKDCLIRKSCLSGMEHEAEYTTERVVESMVDSINRYLPGHFKPNEADHFKANLTVTNLHYLLRVYLEAANRMPPYYEDSHRDIQPAHPSLDVPSYKESLKPPPPKYRPPDDEPPSYSP
jgi:hypothetical protein